MQELAPLSFRPIYRSYVWGGRRLATHLGKQFPVTETVAESWEVVDRADAQSVVASGPLEGTSLAEIRERCGAALFGHHHPLQRFPLLFKFLDAHRNLSVQVHPNDRQAAQLDPPDLGKTEAWVVLHADPESRIYAGLRSGVDRQTLAREIGRGETESCLHSFKPQPGDCVFIPAGTVHALGAGLLVAEIQQASDTTFRLFDWNRVGHDGKPRALHVQQALSVLDDTAGPVLPQAPQPTGRPEVTRLVECDKFVLDRWRLNDTASIGGDNRCHLLAVLAGAVRLAAEFPLVEAGGTVLLPACLGPVPLCPDQPAVLLDIYLP